MCNIYLNKLHFISSINSCKRTKVHNFCTVRLLQTHFLTSTETTSNVPVSCCYLLALHHRRQPLEVEARRKTDSTRDQPLTQLLRGHRTANRHNLRSQRTVEHSSHLRWNTCKVSMLTTTVQHRSTTLHIESNWRT